MRAEPDQPQPPHTGPHRTPSDPPRHPMLRPGVRVCRREDNLLQVGLASHLAVRAPDTEQIREVLSGLRDGVPLPRLNALHPTTARFCIDLLDHGLLIDADDYLPTVGTITGAETRESYAAHMADLGGGALWRRRPGFSIEVRHRGLPTAAALCTSLLTTSNLGTAARDTVADLTVLFYRGVVDREEIDDLVRADRPHLIVCCAEGLVTVGPFVVPTLSACLRCIDAHHTERDPRRSLIIEQYLTSVASAAPEPVPHDLLTAAVACVVRDVATWADGGLPTTWSATLWIDPALTFPRQNWLQHPACGCNWDELYAVG